MNSQPVLDHLVELGNRPVMVMATLQPDGRPQLSLVRPWFHDGVAEISLTATRVKTRNLRGDARAALIAIAEDGQRFVVAEGRAHLSAVSIAPGDATGLALGRLYRALAGDHPDWSDYHHAMVRDQRLLATLTIEHTYTGGTHT